MKILVYGAGPLGSLFAARLQEGGNDVTLLARGKRLEALRANGIVLENGRTGQRTTTRVHLVEQLAPDDCYDLVLVVMRKNRAMDILPVLGAHRHTPNILFLMNNVAGTGELFHIVAAERIMLGFPMSAGYLDGDVVRYLGGSVGHEVKIPLGEPSGWITQRTYEVAGALVTMPGYDVEIRTDMVAWLQTHAALLMPAAPALYATALDRLRLLRTPDALVLAARAIREAMQVLRAAGVPITPARLRLLNWLPEPLLVAYLRALLARPEMEIALFGHVRAARSEIQYHVDQFLELARTTSVLTPAIDRLYRWLDPDTPPLPDGAAALPLDWRGVWLAATGLGSAVELLLLASRVRRTHKVLDAPVRA